MGKPTGFLDYERETAKVLPPKERIQNFNEFRIPLNKEKQKLQGAASAGSALHGMRRSLLPGRYDDRRNGFRLPASQPGS